MEKDILQDWIENKRVELQHQRHAISSQMLLAMGRDRMDRKTISLREAVASSASGVIAEFARKNPTTGWSCQKAKISEALSSFVQAGACACSIQTDGRFYGGALGDLKKARDLVKLPLLRKDLILDCYQLLQSRVMGADAVSLIASTLTPEDCRILTDSAHGLQMEVVLEIHKEEELDYVHDDIDLIRIDLRDAGDARANMERSLALADQLKGKEPLLISGFEISEAETIRFREAGFRGFILGDAYRKRMIEDSCI